MPLYFKNFEQNCNIFRKVLKLKEYSFYPVIIFFTKGIYDTFSKLYQNKYNLNIYWSLSLLIQLYLYKILCFLNLSVIHTKKSDQIKNV